jgi:hypothetical protein
MVVPSLTKISWPRYYRLVNSVYPPIDLFEDIADPKDWELLAHAEGRTNPRLTTSVGQLDLVPVDRRVAGPGSSYVMASFVHASPDRPGRFHDGNYGALYIANTYETALFETIYHTELFCRDTQEPPGWIADMREVTGKVERTFHDIRAPKYASLLHETDYSTSQALARSLKENGSDGIIYPSVRKKGGECIAAFYPDCVEIPIQGRHLSYHWDGQNINLIKDKSDNNKIYKISY